MSIYHWKLGDVALARLCKKVYAKVHVVYDEKGLFYDHKGISANEDDSISVTKELCYYVEISRTKERLWLPYTCLHLAERSRPFYGPSDRSAPTPKPIKPTPAVTKKRKIIEDYTLPFSAKISKTSSKEPDLNTTYDIRHMPLKQGKYENAFSEFIRRGKEMLFDQYFIILQTSTVRDEECLDYLLNVDASTEDKFEMLIKNIATEKELENYLHQCWRYNFVCKQMDTRERAEKFNTSPQKPLLPLIHITWCLVCGKEDKLRQCPNCPSAFHPVCRREWLVTIIHRKNPPQKAQKPVTLVEKILSSTRTIKAVRKDRENIDLCPSCMWGPKVGYDDVVWHKLGPCSWWPARVLTPGSTPSCLLRTSHEPSHWPLRYYGTENYSWGSARRMCLFLPSHAPACADPVRQRALLDAADDYISVYLT